MSFDLDISNYKLQDIFNLFNVTLDFNEYDLKQAKKITLKTHPDKSKLPKEYFLFYSKAYKKLYHIYSFRKNSGKKFEIEYSELINEDETLKEAFTLINKNKNENFNRWFNKTFDELNKTETHGYSEWLSNENSEISEKIKKSKSNKEKEDIIKEEKTKNRELTIYKEIEDTYAVSSVSSCNLSKNKPDYYGNGELFSKNNYEDLKDAYDKSLIPVTDADYNEKKKYNNVFELKKDRKESEIELNSDIIRQQQNIYMENKRKMEEQQGTEIGWELANEVEVSEKKNKEFMSKFSLIKY